LDIDNLAVKIKYIGLLELDKNLKTHNVIPPLASLPSLYSQIIVSYGTDFDFSIVGKQDHTLHYHV